MIKNRRVEEQETTEDSEVEDSSDSEEVGRMVEVVRAAGEKQTQDPELMVYLKPRRGGQKTPISWLADSGVTRSIISETSWEKLRQENPQMVLKKNTVIFRPYGTKVRLPIVGRSKVKMENQNGKKVKTMVYVVKGKSECLLGRKDGINLGIITINEKGAAPEDKVKRLVTTEKEPAQGMGRISGGETQTEIDKNMEKLVEKHKKLFEGIGKVKVAPIHIYTKEGIKPIAQKLRPVAVHLKEPLRKHLEELLKYDVIEGPLESKDATGWVSNVVLTKKSWDSTKIRMNLDMRSMGDTVLQTHFPIPTADQLRHEFAGSDRYSVIDLNHAFHQLELDEESRQLFVFTTPFGLYRFKRLVMGTPPASAECHSKLAQVLKGLKGTVQIKDDLVVHGVGKKHDERLEAVLKRCEEYGITLRREKCQFGKEEVKWFGHVFSKQGMSPDPEKVEAIRQWKAPRDKAGVKSFLQTAQFCSVYMRGEGGETYSDLTKPLRELTKKGVHFKWGEKC